MLEAFKEAERKDISVMLGRSHGHCEDKERMAPKAHHGLRSALDCALRSLGDS